METLRDLLQMLTATAGFYVAIDWVYLAMLRHRKREAAKDCRAH